MSGNCWSMLLGEYIVVPPVPTNAYGWFPIVPERSSPHEAEMSNIPDSQRCRGGGWKNEFPGARDLLIDGPYLEHLLPGATREEKAALLDRVGPPGANEKYIKYLRRLWVGAGKP